MRSAQKSAGYLVGRRLVCATRPRCVPLGVRRWSSPARLAGPPQMSYSRHVTSAPAVSSTSTRTDTLPPSEPDDVDRHLETASAMLQETFGPQARLTLNVLRRRQRAPVDVDASESGDERAAVAPTTQNPTGVVAVEHAETYCRVSATFRLLAFPVELAAVKGTQPEEVIENCLRQALSSDVEFLMPQRRPRGGGPPHVPQTPSTTASTLAAVLPSLRDLCIFFSRSVKFSIKPPLAAMTTAATVADTLASSSSSSPPSPSAIDPQAWRCRAYVRDEWAVVRRAELAVELTGDSPRAALTACASALAERYAAEKASPEVALAGVRELDAMLATTQGKRVVTAQSLPEKEAEDAESAHGRGAGRRQPPSRGRHASPEPAVTSHTTTNTTPPTTLTSTLHIEDARHNDRVVQLRRQPSSLVGLHTAAMLAIKSEAGWDAAAHLYDERLPTVPLLGRLRWQFDCMVRTLSVALRRPCASIARIEVGPLGVNTLGGDVDVGEDEGNEGPGAGTATASSSAPPAGRRAGLVVSRLYRATLVCDEAVVWQATSGGRYRVELEAYAQAVFLLLDQYGCGLVPSVQAQPGLLYPTPALLELALTRHDQLNILTQHRGNWTGYAVLGSLTSQLLGAYYQTHYLFDPVSKYWKATLTVQDGRSTAQVLIERLSLQKGEAWRHACLDALRENFPNQYAAAVAAHPDMDLSTELMARGGRFRVLPRHKRVRHLGTLVDLVSAFAEEDFGWRQLRVRLRNVGGNLGVPQWVAEMEALVDTARVSEWTTATVAAPLPDAPASPSALPQWRRVVVAESPAYTQVKMARRVLVYRLASDYFPKELAVYKTLTRSDAEDPEETATTDGATRRAQLYDPGRGSLVAQLFAQWEAQHPTLAPFAWHLLLLDDQGTGVGDGGAVGRSASEAALAHALAPLRVPHRVQVYGSHGEVLVVDEPAATNADDPAVMVSNVVTSLMAALKRATAQLDGTAATRLWREYETHAYPPLQTTRDLCLYLFTAFLGAVSAQVSDVPSASVPGDMSRQGHAGDCGLVAVEAVQHGEYWFATLTLPRVRHVPLARAIHSTRRGSERDALLLATRLGFRAQLEHMAAHSLTLSALATEILREPIVQVLPEAVIRDMLDECRREERRRVQAQSTQQAPQLHQLLARVQTEFNGSRRLRVQQRQVDALDEDHHHSEQDMYECHIYLDAVLSDATTGAHAVPHVARGQTQLAGQATGSTESAALEAACLDAFHRLF